MEKQDRAFVRFKSLGRFKGTRDVKIFKGEGWKAWLEFQLELDRLFAFLNLDRNDEESMRDLKEIICQLLTRQDLDAFNEKWNRDPRFTMEAISHAMDSVGRRYCVFGTREALHDEIKGLRKTRNMSVEEYDAQFHHLLQLERWVQSEDGEAITVGTKCRYFSAGMPRSWQAAVIPQRSQWESLRSLKARYLQCERIEQYTMNDRANGKGSTSKKRKQEDQKKKTGRRHDEDKRKRKLESDEGCSFVSQKGMCEIIIEEKSVSGTLYPHDIDHGLETKRV